MNKPDDSASQSQRSPKTLEAEELVLKDAAGKVGVRMSATPIGSKLTLYGESGEERVLVSVLGEQPAIILCDAKGKTQATLIVGEDGPCLALEGKEGTPGATLMVKDDHAFLGLSDTSGKVRAVLCVKGNEPLVYLYNAEGEPRAFLGVMFDEGLLDLADSSGKQRVALGGARPPSSAGYAALICLAASLLLAPTIIRAEPGDRVEMIGVVLLFAGIFLAGFWVRARWLWWKIKRARRPQT